MPTRNRRIRGAEVG